MSIDKKFMQMAAKERYIVLQMGVSEARRKEKIQMEKTMLMMIQKVEEMEEKIKEKEVELEDEHMYIEDVGQSVYELIMSVENLVKKKRRRKNTRRMNCRNKRWKGLSNLRKRKKVYLNW